MAAVVWNNTRNSFKYTSVVGNESVTRTIGGLNRTVNTGDADGPQTNIALTFLIDAISSLSTSSLSNGRFIMENEVTF